MKIGILKETLDGERRVAITPIIAKLLIAAGFEIIAEEGAGEYSSFKDSDYTNVAVAVEKRGVVFHESEILLKINPFDEEDLKLVDAGQILISKLYHKSNPELIQAIANKGATAFSMDAIPRKSVV